MAGRIRMMESPLLPLSYNLLDPADQLYTNTGIALSLWALGNSKPAPLGDSMNRFLALAVAIALISPTPLLAQTNQTGTVLSTGDGDTLRVQLN